MKLNGVDISGWDYGIDTAELTANFVIVKSTEGVLGTIYNPTYREMADKAASSGKLIGFYHYANGGDPIAEADCFYQSVKDYVGEAIFALDWEGQGNPTFESGRDVAWCKEFLDEIDRKTGSIPWLYISKGVANQYDWSKVSAKYPLWGAEYGDEINHIGYLSNPWQSKLDWGAWKQKGCVMHQWGYVNPVPNNGGIHSGLDADLFFGDEDLWRGFAGTGATQAPYVKPVTSRRRVNVNDIAALIHFDMVTDERNGYSQAPHRYGGDWGGYKTLTIYGRNYTYALGSYDCSSSTIVAWQLALKYTPYEGALNGATYTGDMKDIFVKSGLFKASLSPAKRGDLYLNEGSHVAMCQDGGSDGIFGYDCLSEFNRNEFHSATNGQPGDQDGQESVFRPFYGNWETVLHYVGDIELYDASQSENSAVSSNMVTECEEDEMVCFIKIDGSNTLHYYDGYSLHAIANPDEKEAINKVHKALHDGANLKTITLGSKEAPYGARFNDAISRGPAFETMNTFTKH